MDVYPPNKPAHKDKLGVLCLFWLGAVGAKPPLIRLMLIQTNFKDKIGQEQSG